MGLSGATRGDGGVYRRLNGCIGIRSARGPFCARSVAFCEWIPHHRFLRREAAPSTAYLLSGNAEASESGTTFQTELRHRLGRAEPLVNMALLFAASLAACAVPALAAQASASASYPCPRPPGFTTPGGSLVNGSWMQRELDFCQCPPSVRVAVAPPRGRGANSTDDDSWSMLAGTTIPARVCHVATPSLGVSRSKPLEIAAAEVRFVCSTTSQSREGRRHIFTHGPPATTAPPRHPTTPPPRHPATPPPRHLATSPTH